MKIQILLADTQKEIREGLRELLSNYDDFDVVAEADTGENAVALAAKHQPDVVVMDIALPGVNGIEATRLILAGAPDTKVIALAINIETHHVT